MDRSLFPEGVEVHQDDLQNTEDSRSFHILRRHMDVSVTGVVSGLKVTPNAGNPAIVDVASGYGYSPNGEYVELPNNITAIPLADSTFGVLNLVCVVYTETNDKLESHETSGETLPTIANRGFRLRVFTQAQYDVLPQSDNNLTIDAIDRILIVAAIAAQGPGSALTIDDIELPKEFGSAINVVNLDSDVTGVGISSASPETPNGTGSLVWNFGAGTLSWTAPGDVSGNNVNVLTGGSYQLQSFPSNSVLTVFVTASLLPISNQTDSIQVQNLYFSNAPRFTAEDIHHRSLIGSGIPTLNNPHGLTLADLGIAGTPIEEHQNTFHSNGIRRDSSPLALAPTVNTGTSPDRIDIAVPGTFFVAIRGSTYVSANGTFISFTDVATNTQFLFDLYAETGVNAAVDLEKRERVRFNALSTLTNHVQLRDINRTTGAGAGLVEFNDTADTLTYTAPGDAAGEPRSIPVSGSVYIRLFSNNEIDYIDLLVRSNLNGTGNHSEAITVTAIPTTIEMEDRLHIATVFYSGQGTGFLGNGFGVNNAPNAILDKRLFGITGPFDLRDDAGNWEFSETTEAQSPALITNRQVGIIDPDFSFDTPFAGLGPYPLGTAHLTIKAKAHVVGRAVSQEAIASIIQYSTAEGGLKQSIRSDLDTDFTSGTIADAWGIASLLRLRHSGTGLISNALGFWARVDVDTDADVTNLYGIRVDSPSGTAANGVEVTNAYGIKIENQLKGANNWALYTDLGTVRFGDTTQLDGASSGLLFTNTNQVMLRSNGINAIIDGATNPGSDGVRVSFAGSVVSALVNTDLVLPNDLWLIEKTDGNSPTPDGVIVFANTGNDGIIDAALVILGNGAISPGFNAAQNFGSSAVRWNGIYGQGAVFGFNGTAASNEVQVGDANFKMSFIGATEARMQFDSGDWIRYDRTANDYIFRLANADELRLTNSELVPEVNNGLSLGTSGQRWSGSFTTNLNTNGTVVHRNGANQAVVFSFAHFVDVSGPTNQNFFSGSSSQLRQQSSGTAFSESIFPFMVPRSVTITNVRILMAGFVATVSGVIVQIKRLDTATLAINFEYNQTFDVTSTVAWKQLPNFVSFNLDELDATFMRVVTPTTDNDSLNIYAVEVTMQVTDASHWR